jgi:UDP-N-acetylmuramyl tripeptide synthase
MKAELADSRRLTGANLFWDLPAAIIDARIEGEPGALIHAWAGAARQLLAAVGRANEQLAHRVFDGGASLLISAPVDVLYSMCELNECAFKIALADQGLGEAPDPATEAGRLRELFGEEANPRLLALQRAAHEHGAPFLWDDDEVSVGYGRTALVWPSGKLPKPEEIDWPSIGSVPVALVTGTNGKSTTVRMSASILAATGLRAGLTSTDWIRIGDTILDTGDYSGTGGARMLMRHPDTQVAVLETARGGLLRRGLGVERAAAALITNVDADHLGDYGINTVPELIEAKFIVRRALGADAPLILNADDPGIVAYAQGLDCRLAWFGLDPANPVIRDHVASGGLAAVLDGKDLELVEGGRARKIVTIEEVPSTLGGVARHNVQNALGAMAVCTVLGAADAAIRDGLMGFSGDEHDNPGRGNWFRKGDIRILVDFAHNVHGMKALTGMVLAMPAKRRILMMGQAGDRLDRDIRQLAGAACELEPDLIMLCELPGYLRGRTEGEVPALIRRAAIDCGVPAEKISCFDTPAEAARHALDGARPGDLMVFLALTQREEVLEMVHRFISV